MRFFILVSSYFQSGKIQKDSPTLNMKNMKITVPVSICISVIIVLLALPIKTQTKPEILTNAKIIELVRLGLDEEIIVEKIRQSECRCDLGTSDLAKLKTAKVPKAVIMAMLESSSNRESSSSPNNERTADRIAETKNVSVEPKNPTSGNTPTKFLNQMNEPGIYLLEAGKVTAIEPSIFSGSKMNPLMGTLTYGIKKTKYRAKVRGRSANMQVSSSKPEFYFVFNPEYKNSGATMAGGLWWGMPATSPAEFMLVEMNQKEASREAVLGEFGAWTGMSMGARDKDIREYSFEKIKSGIYKVVPKTDLAPGEYCFYYAGNVAGLGIAGGKVFDFSVIK